ICAAAILSSTCVHGQTPTGTMLGKVLDPSGAAVTGASVRIVNEGTALTREIRATEHGEYIVSSLPIGVYTLSVTAPGFATFSQSGIVVELGQNARVDARLRVGSASEKIEVSETTTQVDTASSAVSTEIDSKQIVELPLDTRNVLQLITLVPG